jgi:hypothetical protein
LTFAQSLKTEIASKKKEPDIKRNIDKVLPFRSHSAGWMGV